MTAGSPEQRGVEPSGNRGGVLRVRRFDTPSRKAYYILSTLDLRGMQWGD